MIRQLKKLRKKILVLLTHKIALPMLKLFRKPNVFPYNLDDLRSMPVGSLGNDLFVFLSEKDLPLLKHYARHDLKHVLLDYDTTEEGEACLQSFMLGNGRISFPVLATVMYGFITMPEYHSKMKKAFFKGRNSRPIHQWKWHNVIHFQTTELRKKVFI
jgi:ubiquinone biosynthesis protein Coq4